MPYMTRIGADLVGAGLAVEYVPGWQTRGNPAFAPGGVVCHWTAGPRGTVTRPSLNVVTHGRVGIPGPLCNVYLARDGVAVIVAAGRANHAGAGGTRGLVGNSAVYGIEAESGGDGDWTPAQRIAYPRVVAALLRGLGRGPEFAVGHSEWAPTRKIDIRDWTMNAMRQQVAALLAAPATPAAVAIALALPTPPPRREDDDMIADIDALYRYLLGRDPKTDADARAQADRWLIDAMAGGHDVRWVRDGLAGSIEARRHAVTTGYARDLGRPATEADYKTWTTGPNAKANAFAIAAGIYNSGEAQNRRAGR